MPVYALCSTTGLDSSPSSPSPVSQSGPLKCDYTLLFPSSSPSSAPSTPGPACVHVESTKYNQDVKTLRRLLVLAPLIAAFANGQTSAVMPPAFSASTVLADGVNVPSPLAPGMIVSIYGSHLGPVMACNGSPEPTLRESPNPRRPNQTLVETQVFPKSLCEVVVRVGGIAAGLLHVRADQINFQVPQQAAVNGTTDIRVSYKGQSGPVITIGLSSSPNTSPADQLAGRILSGLQAVQWESAYRQQGCSIVPPHSTSLRGGLYGHAYYCFKQETDLIAETFYYPVGATRPAVLLRRADFRLAQLYPAMTVEVEQILRQRLTRMYGPGVIPVGLHEVGATRPNPGMSWRAGAMTIFVHRNQNPRCSRRGSRRCRSDRR